MSDPRIIKKYPNRRLYDFGLTRYVTLADIRKLVMREVDFTVVVHDTEADITRSILLQALIEQEESGKGWMGEDFIRDLIRKGGKGGKPAAKRKKARRKSSRR